MKRSEKMYQVIFLLPTYFRAHLKGNQFDLLAVGFNLSLPPPPPLQPDVLLLGQAALARPGQRGSPASGLPAHAGALWDIPGVRYAHWDFCPGNHHTGASRQRAVFQRWWCHPQWAFLRSPKRRLHWRRDGGADVGWEVQFKPRLQLKYGNASWWRQASVLQTGTRAGAEPAADARPGGPETWPGEEETGEAGGREGHNTREQYFTEATSGPSQWAEFRVQWQGRGASDGGRRILQLARGAKQEMGRQHGTKERSFLQAEHRPATKEQSLRQPSGTNEATE